jgi:hypothetical protein
MRIPNAIARDRVRQRVDAWWSEWLSALDLLTEAELGIPGVCGKWSAHELMAHVDGWDRHALLTVRLRAAGEPLDEPQLRGVNRRSAEQNHGLNPAESRALMERAHDELLAELDRVGAIEPSWVAEDTYRHYPDHVSNIMEWHAGTAAERDSAWSNLDVAAEIDRQWQIWLHLLDGIPEGLRREEGVCGKWSIHDLVGHVTTWDEISRAAMTRRIQNEPAPSGPGWREINRQAFERNRDRAFDDLWSEMLATHEAVLAIVRSNTSVRAGWTATSTYAHYREHIPQVRAWRRWRL